MIENLQPTRRNVLRSGVAMATASFLPGRAVAIGLDRRARGVVRTPDGAGLAGVLVTNGRDIARTDANGRYELPLDGDVIISVIKPAGYAPPVDPLTRQPRFYYIHQPQGTPAEFNMAFAGLAPTGPLPASVDFVLTPQNEPDAYEAILFADPQPETHAEVDFIRDGVVPGLVGTRAAFGVTLGDIVGDNLGLYDRLNQIIGQIGAPWYNVPGNHDLNFESPNDRYARETYKRIFGPTHYAFAYGKALYIMLNNVVYGGADASGPLNESPYGDGISREQLAFVANLLAQTPADTLIVLGMHVPLRSWRGADGREMAVDDCAELLKLLGDRPCVSFSGHTHMSEHRYIHLDAKSAPHHHQVLATVSGSWWSGPYDRRGVAIADACDGSPSGYYILSVNGTTCETRFQSANEARERQVRAVLCEKLPDEYRSKVAAKLRGPALSIADSGRTELVVNVFDGGPRTRVSCSIGKGQALEMARENRADPFVASVYARNRSSIKPWVNAENSSHVWSAALPNDLPAGVHRLDIVATDEFGRTHRDHLVFEVMGQTELLAMRG